MGCDKTDSIIMYCFKISFSFSSHHPNIDRRNECECAWLVALFVSVWLCDVLVTHLSR